MASENPYAQPYIIRPMLPPLRTLGLPDSVSRNSERPPRDDIDSPVSMNNDFTRWHRARESSISSMTSSCTTSTSSTESIRYSSPFSSRDNSPSPPATHVATASFSLVLTTFDKANAFVVIPPPQSYVPNISALSRANASASSSRSKARRNQALLVIGPAVEDLRRTRLRIAEGARIHPYRIVSQTGTRRPSASPERPSSTSQA